jgi:apoptogenic protein 1
MSFILKVFSRARPSSRELVGPPHPVSNIRSVLFRGQSSPSSPTTHPYSLAEFGETDEDSTDLQWRIERERLNAFNHAFWLDVSARGLYC